MPSSEEMQQMYRDACELCAKGVPVRMRHDTHEWVHDQVLNKVTNGVRVGHCMCGAHELRKQNG